MENEIKKTIPPKIEETPQKEIRIFPDTSVFYAFFDEEDMHYESSTSLLGYLKGYKKNIKWCINFWVIAETMSKLCKNKNFTTKKSVKTVQDFLNKENMGRGGKILNLKEIFERYKRFGKRSITRKLKTSDFYIATEGMLIGGLILTSDFNFYKYVKKSYPDVFFVSTKSPKQKSEIDKLVKRIQKEIG